MLELLEILRDTPIPSILVIGGIAFLLLAFIRKIGSNVEIEPSGKWLAGLIGIILMCLGVALYAVPIQSTTSSETSTQIVSTEIINEPQNQPTQTIQCSANLTWDMKNPILGGSPTRVGSLNANNEWVVNPSQDNQGWFQVGPYTKQLVAGDYIATWYLMIDDNSSDDSEILRLEIAEYQDDLNQTVLTSRVITRKDWNAPQTYQCFSLPFRADSNNKSLEFRIWWYGIGSVSQLRVSVD